MRNQDEGDVGKNADLDAAASFLLSVNFAHDVGREEGRCEKDVTECGVEPEGVHQNKHLDVCGDGADDGPGKDSLLSEEAEKADEASKEHENGGDEDEFVLERHCYLLLSIAVKSLLLASASNSVPGLP